MTLWRLIKSLSAAFVLHCLWQENLLAQRLTTGVTAPGPHAFAVYGRVLDGNVYLFETKYALDPIVNAPLLKTQKREVPQPSLGNATTTTNFSLPQSEVKLCLRAPRVAALKALLKAFAARVLDLRISATEESADCAERIAKTLKSVAPGAVVTTDQSAENGIFLQIVMATGSVANQKKEDSKELSVEEETINEEEKKLFVRVQGEVVPVTAEGYFILEMTGLEEVEVSVEQTGFQIWRKNVRAQSLIQAPTRVSPNPFYKDRVTSFRQSTTYISVGAAPVLDNKTSIDTLLGGGIGYGREIPGERRGQRFAASLGAEQRELYKSLGARASLLYTRASATAVPQTFTARGYGFLDLSAFNHTVITRIGGGMEIFQAQIDRKSAPATTRDAPVIPEQVVAPLLMFSMTSLIVEKYILGLGSFITPLYVQDFGFYPSVSPMLEAGVKLSKDWVVTFQGGYELHRFPGPIGETKLQMEFLFLNLKRGIF